MTTATNTAGSDTGIPLGSAALDKLEALARAATPGPWKHYKERLRPNFPTIVNEVQPQKGEAIIKWGGFDGLNRAKSKVASDARFIAAANPATVLALIAQLRAATAPSPQIGQKDERAPTNDQLVVPAWVYRSARDLAASIWRDNYKSSAPQWEPLDDLAGVISQIDNMVTGMVRAPLALSWVKEAPTEQADYWHWDGDEDHAPMIYHVLWSGTAKKCFVSIGQYGIDKAIWCDNFGGWWLKIDQPALPGRAALAQAAPADLTDDFDAFWAKRVPQSDDSLHAKVFAAEVWNAAQVHAAVVAIPAPAVWYVANGNRVERVHGGLLAQTYIHAEAVFIANALNWFTASPAQPAGAGAPSIDTPEFRKLLGYVQGWHDGLPILSPDSPVGYASRNLITHIDAHVARQGAAPADEPTTYTVDGVTMSPIEYIAHLHGQIEAARQVGKHLYDAVSQGAAPAQAEPVAMEGRRFCKGDNEWTDWTPMSKAEYERRKGDASFEFRATAPAPVAQAAICQPGGEPLSQRASFEKWYSDDGQSPRAVERFGDGYKLMSAQSAWEVWKACYAALGISGRPVPASPQSPQASSAECDHGDCKAKWDHILCNQCGSVRTDHQWGIASGQRFRSLDEAKFYREHGRLPDCPPQANNTGSDSHD